MHVTARLNGALAWKEPLGAAGILAKDPLRTATLGAATLHWVNWGQLAW